MCKIIYDNEIHELKDVPWNITVIMIRSTQKGRHIIANDNLLHGR